MSPDPNDLLAQQLQQLRLEYLHDSTARIDELRQLRDRLASEGRATLTAFRQAFHRLAGSGGSYGFPDVSSHSREGERLVMNLESPGAELTPADLTALDQCIDGVATAFSAAKKALRSPGMG